MDQTGKADVKDSGLLEAAAAALAGLEGEDVESASVIKSRKSVDHSKKVARFVDEVAPGEKKQGKDVTWMGDGEEGTERVLISPVGTRSETYTEHLEYTAKDVFGTRGR